MPELKSRLKQKHDTEANWNKATNFVPLAGEIIVYDADSTHRFSRIKVGNGSTKVTELPFLSNDEVYKNLYNLGAYDTFVDNGNGTATITRKTGYFYLSPEYADEHYFTCYINVGEFIQSTFIIGDSTTVPEDSQPVECNTLTGANPWAGSNYSLWVKKEDFTLCIALDNVAEHGTKEYLLQWLSEHPTYMQYELNTSYTEEVILDQPIHTIDQHGEQWLRDEWEKGLNLIDDSSVAGTVLNISRMFDVPVTLETGDYSICIHVNGVGTVANTCDGYLSDVNGNDVVNVTGQGDATNWNACNRIYYVTVTASQASQITKFHWFYNNDGGISGKTLTGVSIYKGRVQYPYHPYNGDIIRQKDIENVYSPDNPPPYPVTSVNGKTGAISSNDVISYYNMTPITWAALQNLPTAFGIEYTGDSDAIVQFSNSLHKAHLVIDGNIYVNEGQELVASQNWVNSALDGYVPQTNLSSQAQVDLNELTDAGMYRMGLIVVNGPTGIEITHGQVLVVHGGGDTVAQIAFPYMDTHHVNIRVGNPLNSDGGVWSEWERIVFADEMTQYALKTDIPSDATTTTKGIATLGASGGAARYGQKGDVGLSNVDNVRQYSASNPPPYPVTSVNGQTGAVVVKIDDGIL